MLEKYGLNNYENKVYLKLLELGQEDARTISQLSGVPVGRIYDVLDTLVSLAIVIENSGRPKKFYAIEPEIAINTLIQKQKDAVGQLEKVSQNEIKELTKIYNAQPRDRLIWKVAVGEDIQRTYMQFVNEANIEFLTYVDVSTHYDGVQNELSEIKEALALLESRGVSIKIIVGMETIEKFNDTRIKELELVSSFGLYDIRITEISSNPFTLIDGNNVLLKIDHPTDPNEMLALMYFNEQKLSSTLKSEFEKMWKSAKPLEIKLGLAKTV